MVRGGVQVFRFLWHVTLEKSVNPWGIWKLLLSFVFKGVKIPRFKMFYYWQVGFNASEGGGMEIA
jgi:hypothetical protein